MGLCTLPQPRRLRGRMTRACFALLVISLALPVRAEMDPSDYEVPPAELTEEEATTLRDRIASEIAADRARAAAEAKARSEAEAAEAARLAARPPGEQLVDARCGLCHGPDSYRNANLGWLGWQATVWRMDIINGARVEQGEHGLITDWLYAQYPPSGARAALEWLALLLVGVALPLFLALPRLRIRRD